MSDLPKVSSFVSCGFSNALKPLIMPQKRFTGLAAVLASSPLNAISYRQRAHRSRAVAVNHPPFAGSCNF